jgi:hypothetical protein
MEQNLKFFLLLNENVRNKKHFLKKTLPRRETQHLTQSANCSNLKLNKEKFPLFLFRGIYSAGIEQSLGKSLSGSFSNLQ